MADFLNPATVPILPAAQAVEDRRYPEPRQKPKPVVRRVQEPAIETEPDEPEEGETQHALDLDA